MLTSMMDSKLRRDDRFTSLKSAARWRSTLRMVLLIAAMVSVPSVGARADVVDAAVKFTGIRACNVGQHSEFWNTHIAPGTCSATFFRMIGGRPELQRAGLNELIAHCKGGG